MRNTIRFAALALAATLVLSVNTTAHGAIVAYQVTSSLPAVGNQNFGGTLGLDFTVNQSIAILALGAFDSGQDGLNSPITVRLWQRTGNTGTQVLGTGGQPPPLTISLLQGTVIGNYRFVELANPLTLTAGTYTISAEGYSSSELNFNANVANSVVIQGNTGGGQLSFTNSRFGGAGAFPSNPGPFSMSSGPFVFGGPSFAYAPVPEPGTLLLIGSGLVGIGVGTRRRSGRK